MDIARLDAILADTGQPAFRRAQILKAVLRDGVSSFRDITTLDTQLRATLDAQLSILPFVPLRVVRSADGRAVKALLQLADRQCIETVLIAPKPAQWTACISSQVGCAMGCAFCATGKNGIARNLSADEIAAQALFWRQYVRRQQCVGTFARIVYMGMGEPFHNWDAVAASIDMLTDLALYAFARRALSVSTSGLAPGIRRFADACDQVNLAVSLHFATDDKRSRYMPVNRRYGLAELADALRYYFTKNNRKVFMEYIMLDGINDTPDDARHLIAYLRSIGRVDLLHVNLIRYNVTDATFAPSPVERVRAFRDQLIAARVPCTIRKSIGDDIHSACGQLAGLRRPERAVGVESASDEADR